MIVRFRDDLVEEAPSKRRRVAHDLALDCCRVEGHYCSLPESTRVVVVVKFVYPDGSDASIVHPVIHATALSRYGHLYCRDGDTQVYEALSNMAFARASDPRDPEGRIPLQVQIHRPAHPTCKSIILDHPRCYTFLTVPPPLIGRHAEKTDWIKSSVATVLQAIRELMMSRSYTDHLLESTTTMRRAAHVRRICDPSKTPNLPTFFRSAAVTVRPVLALTNHFFRPDARRIGELLVEPPPPYSNCDNVGATAPLIT